MKLEKKQKILIASITIFIVFLLAIVSDSSDSLQSPEETNQAVCSHSYVKISTLANCTQGGMANYKCSICNQLKTEYESALGHNTKEGVCSKCGKEFGIWEMTYYVDEFGQYTDQAYVRNKDYFVGKFSNSATTNSKLYVGLLIDLEDVAIKLLEYGSYEVKSYSNQHYDITYLDDAGQKYYSTGTMYKNGDRIYLNNRKLIELLQKNNSVDIYIKENSEYGVNSTYLVTITKENFNSIYTEFLNK